MRAFHLLDNDKTCLRCKLPLRHHMSTPRCSACELPVCPTYYTTWPRRVEYLMHPDYPGSTDHRCGGKGKPV